MNNKTSNVQQNSNNPNLIYQQMLDNISNDIASQVVSKITDRLENIQPKQVAIKEEYYTIKETCEILNISRTTLYNWNKKGVLISDAWNGRPMYTKSNIDRFRSGQEPRL